MALWWENQFGHLPVTLGKLPTVLATNAHGGLLCTGQRVKCFKFFFYYSHYSLIMRYHCYILKTLR